MVPRRAVRHFCGFFADGDALVLFLHVGGPQRVRQDLVARGLRLQLRAEGDRVVDVLGHAVHGIAVQA